MWQFFHVSIGQWAPKRPYLGRLNKEIDKVADVLRSTGYAAEEYYVDVRWISDRIGLHFPCKEYAFGEIDRGRGVSCPPHESEIQYWVSGPIRKSPGVL